MASPIQAKNNIVDGFLTVTQTHTLTLVNQYKQFKLFFSFLEQDNFIIIWLR